VLVTSARPDAVAEASFFAEKLAERDVVPAALVVNRIHPHFGRMDEPGSPVPVGDAPDPLAALEANLFELNQVSEREEDSFADLAGRLSPAPVGRIPLFGHDVHDLEALERTADHLFSSSVRP
jgi:anion-transporting  ArsA/GET3 family ATPase